MAADLGRSSVHSALGRVTLGEMINEWVAHDLMHTVQAERALMQPFIVDSGACRRYFTDHDVEAKTSRYRDGWSFSKSTAVNVVLEFMGMYRWFGRGRYGEPEKRLSVLDLVKSGTLDLRLASLLWVIMEHRASVLVAAGPSFAGKTTTLNVLLDFLRPEVKEVRLSGYDEDFGFVDTAEPANTYIVAEEFSDYGDYVWGETAQRAFNLMKEGYALGGTIHARTAREVAYILNQYLELPIETIARLDVIVTLGVGGRRGYEPVRRIDSVSLFVPVGDKTGIQTIASNELGGGTFAIADDKTLQAALLKRFPPGEVSVWRAMTERELFLGKMLPAGKIDRDTVRKGILEFYAANPP